MKLGAADRLADVGVIAPITGARIETQLPPGRFSVQAGIAPITGARIETAT